ncbi:MULTISPECIES: nickel/cobalt efflux transporter [unclassified Bradyrhizobium]|uniref:nickel/cobalt efflux transporter n=1 Tax=unclassified Bradyrhizobium TaxID=2631580 RepID=UPI001FF830FB|nr:MULTISPECIES: nickel/cobalt efflux transporter [unclassified Bradyrhizobium]MCK1497825.1 nickel/cobalt efflux transporter RcnA [Bradyrhizobium sp. 188]UPJ80741.1 nickel/cobalt efflux transporter RcnA [Bradyrhizobium sp. 184]UPJ88534.1 nickel/cobalt efflux transporter RcnA [Bradyrhizobium sp. 183]
MTDLSQLLQQSSAHAWLFVPSAILLGALHGLEPGHSKTMMAAFIVAIRGTVFQAVLLGLSATISHTAVVWAVALLGLYFGQDLSGERSEAYLQIASALIILGVAAWMVWRTWREQNEEHDHHYEEPQLVTLAGRTLSIEVFEDGVPPRWRIRSDAGGLPSASDVRVTTVRADGTEQTFAFAGRDGYLESTEEIPEPHAFKVRLALDGDVAELLFEEHDHAHMDLGEQDDAHARAHAADIHKRFAGRTVTTPQIVLFGLTGGLIPCPAAITVLLLCIQLKQFSLGFVLVLCFGIGLAITMVSAGVVAALSIRHVERHWSGFSRFAHRAPYVSAALIVLVGVYTGWSGLHELMI